MNSRRQLARRLSVGVVDQILSSGSNFVALLAAARYLNVEGFGNFALAMLSFTLTLGLARALCSEALLVRPGDDGTSRQARTRAATGAVIWVGIVAATAFAAVALSSSGTLARCFAVLAVAIPGLLLQDTLRYAAFSRAEPKAALLSDATWFGLMLVILAALITQGTPSAPAMLAAFAIPGVLAGLLQAIRERLLPAVYDGIGWIQRNGDLSVRYALDFLSGAGAAQLASYVLALVAGVAEVGAIRGSQTLFGPVNILLTGAYIVLVPEGRHAARRSKRSLTKVCFAASGVFMIVSGAMLVIFLLMRPEQGQAILGNTWFGARAVVVPVGLAAIAGGALAGPTAGLRSLAAAKIILRVRLFTIPTTVALPVLGAVMGDAKGLAYGIAIAVWWNVGWYWNGYFRALAEFDVDAPDEAPTGGAQ